jgi:hypothetical protein
MTMSFADQVREAVANAEGAAENEPAQRFRAVLDELKTGLEGLGVGARIQSGRDPRKLTLYLYPPHRPSRVNLMLSFFIDGEGIVVVGEGSSSIKTSDDLQRWLLRYVQSESFVESLRVLRDEAKLPVEARLRVDRQVAHAVGDMVVVVAPEDQERLNAAARDAEITIDVARSAFPGNGTYTVPTVYVLLESAGLFVSVERVEPTEDLDASPADLVLMAQGIIQPTGERLRVRGRRT